MIRLGDGCAAEFKKFPPPCFVSVCLPQFDNQCLIPSPGPRGKDVSDSSTQWVYKASLYELMTSSNTTMSSFPPWLHYAVIAGTDDITFYPLPSTLADVIPAICVAVDCAKAVIKTPSGIEALKSSFDEDDRAGVSGGTIPAALDALHVYVFHAPLEDADAFHVPPRALGDTGIHSMNVFIRQSVRLFFAYAIFR